MSHGKPVSVLVVDDNLDTADSLGRFLWVGAGFDVRTAYDGPTAMKLAADRMPDVVVRDIAMPKVSGLGVAAALSKADPKPLLIAVTGFAAEFPEAMAREAGFDYYPAKPADPFVIETLIRNRKADGR